ncbi:hypothetical protein HMPREF9946_03157 [Acetobacteraceae bacterium AT-5844]|nr:hypothetical protein HMPREF9946_03157 [Acetobacteraceae bacterium AT-5844]
MTVETAFERFGERFAAGGTATEPTDTQANAGLAFLGANPPTFGLHNALFQWLDDKDNWLYGQMASVMADAGVTPTASNMGLLLASLNGSYARRSDFANSLNQNGYIKTPGGVIIQWGRGTTPPSGQTTAGATVVFPIAFPTATLCVVANSNGPANSTVGYIPVVNTSYTTNAGCSIVMDTLSANQTPKVNFDLSVPFSYIAIGC